MSITAREARLLVEPSNVTPTWLLIYWRLVKRHTGGDHAAAWKLLPKHLPAGEKRPQMEVAAVTLIDHGLMR